MESFYGGRQGASFVIKKKFKYLDPCDPAYLAKHDFISCYKNSSGTYVFTNLNGETTSDMPNRWDIMSVCLEDTGYQDVWYNEYCIIDTDNKNNPNNGKIFRRVLPNEDYATPGYEHIGTIVGPSSGAAMLKPQSGLLKLGNIREELAKDNWDGLGILVKDNSGNDKPVIYDPSFTSEDNIARSKWPGNIEPKVYPVEIGKGLVHAIDPKDKTIVTKKTVVEDGKTKIKTSYNSDKIVNDIKYNWFNVRKNTENNDGVVESWCYIGFEIPAPSFTVEALYKTPGTKPEVSLTDNANDFAFWHDIHFDIPGGIRGISVERIYTNDNKDTWNLQETEELEGEQIAPKKAWTFDQIHYDVKTDTYSITSVDGFAKEEIQYNKNKASTISTNYQKEYTTKAWFCDLCIINPKDSAEGDEWPVVLKNLRFFLGYIEEIEHVDLNTDTGHLVFKYHNEDEDAYDLRYPIDVNMDPYTGHVKVDYSLLEEDGITHTKEEWDFRYPVDVDMNIDTGRVITTYSCANDLGPKEEIEDFRYPIDVYMDTKTGEVTTTYSLINRTEGGDPILDENGQYIHETETEYFRYPIDIQMDEETGEVVTTYSCAKGEDMPAKTIHNFRYPIDVNMDTETGHVEVEYSLLDENNNHVKEEWDFRYPTNMEMDTQSGVITTTYSLLDENDNHETTKWELDYPKSINFIEKTESSGLKYYDKVQIDYSQTGIKETPLGYTYKVEVDDNNNQGYIKFINTQGESYSQKHDFSYPTDISINAETGEVLTTYFGAADKTSYVSFIEDVKISPAHELLIAYTGDVKNVNFTGYDPVKDKENGKTYINYGQTIGTLGIMSGPMPSETDNVDVTSIDAIVDWYNSTHTKGQLYGEGDVSGKLHVVTTEPVDGTEPISYFVMWNPDTKIWYNVSEIAGAPVGVPAQIGGTLTTGGQENWTYADSEEMLADGAIRFVQLKEDEQPLTTAFPWM